MGKITAEAIRIKLSQIIRDQMFELQWNGIKTETVDNPNAGFEHRFKAYRLNGQSNKVVSMKNSYIINEQSLSEDE